MNLIEQDLKGQTFAVGYQDNGKCYVYVFDQAGKEIDTVDVSELFEITDRGSTSITGFYEPLVTVQFLPGTTSILIQFYHRIQQKSYNCLYNYDFFDRGQKGPTFIEDLPDCSAINFPMKTFYSEETSNFTTFFRQGECVTVSKNMDASRNEDVTTADMGNMYMMYDKVLIFRSSNSIIMMSINKDTGRWMEYHRINKMRG